MLLISYRIVREGDESASRLMIAAVASDRKEATAITNHILEEEIRRMKEGDRDCVIPPYERESEGSTEGDTIMYFTVRIKKYSYPKKHMKFSSTTRIHFEARECGLNVIINHAPLALSLAR